MKLTIVALTTLLTLSTAQNLGAEPACATACLSSAISKAGCAESDEACQCGPTQASIGAIVATCLLASCPATQLAAVQSIGLALCAQYSASLTMTATAPATTVTSTAGSSLPVGPGPVSVSSTMTSKSVVATSTMTTTAAAVSSSSSAASSVSSVASSVSAKSSGSATTSAPATVSSSAAMALLANGLGGLAALFFGVAATL